MKLSVHDRLILLNVLPATGDITTLRIVRDLGTALGFTDEEHQALDFKQEDGSIQWDNTAEESKAVEVGPTASAMLREAFETLSEEKTLNLAQLSLYERFEEPDEEE